MATELKKDIKRKIRLPGVDGWINVTITPSGLQFAAPRSSKSLSLEWREAIKLARTPNNVPAHLFGKPLEFIQAQLTKVKKGKA